MVDVTWPLSTSPGLRFQEGSGRLINAFAEPRGEDLGPVWRRAPGASIFGEEDINTDWAYWSLWEYSLGSQEPRPALDGSYRGGVIVGETLWAAFGEKIYTVNSDGEATLVGALPGADKVFFARNNASTPQIVVVCNDGPHIVTATTVVAYTDLDIGSPNSVTSHDGYFMFGYGSGRVQSSDLNSTNINTLNSIDTESNPDGVVRPWSYGGQLYIGGALTIEVWGYPVNTTGFPLNRAGYHITPGLLAPHAIAGFEPEFGHPPIYVGSDRTVRQLNGVPPDKISPPDLDRLIAAVADPNDIDALCYVVDGHAWWQVNGPTFSWAFNLNNQKWIERQSYGLTRSRFTGSIYAFDMWLVGDTEEGQLLAVSSVKTEANEPLIFTMESAPVEDFPNRMRVSRADFDFVVGVGNAQGEEPIETDPTVRISYSNDGGVNWSTPANRKLGRQANTGKRIILPPTGMTGTQGRRWRVIVSDPVHVGMLGSTMDATLRVK